MALGGGTWTVQNKKLPGAYINVISAASASATLSDRGICTMPIELDWGPEDEVFKVESGDFQKDSLKIFGHAYTDDAMKGLRDLFLNAKTAYLYRINGDGAKASNNIAEAIYPGSHGDDFKIAVLANADEEGKYDVITYLGSTKLETQTVEAASDLVDNDWVKFKDVDLASVLTAGENLTGGADGDPEGYNYQAYLDKISAYTFNTMGAVVTDDTTKSLFANFVKTMREDVGQKFQLVLYQYEADYLGTIDVKNSVNDDGWSKASLVYWVTGVECACAVNRSVQNTKYDGEFNVDVEYSQSDLEDCIDKGEFVLHRVGDDIRVLTDINSMVTTTEDCGDIFKDNQTIRVVDQFANDIADTFNTKYLGVVPNNESGRISLWSDVVKLLQQLQDISAIQNFEDSDVTVAEGDTKKSVLVNVSMEVVNAMDKMYMTVTVS